MHHIIHNIFNLTNLKSLITFMHLTGLAFGVGGTWILDALLLKHLHDPITRERYHTIVFVSKAVLLGLIILWLSGLFFLAYYYFFTPGLLMNQKVWAKVIIVSVLSTNGLLVHHSLLPKIKASVGLQLLQSLNSHELKSMTAISTVSFVSWLFPIVLGVLKTLNCTVPATEILIAYALFLMIALCISYFAIIPAINRKSLPHQ